MNVLELAHGTEKDQSCGIDTKYHLVWAPQYRKWILRDDIRERVEEIFKEISRNYDFEIDTLEIAEDDVHVFLSFPSRYSISGVVGC